MPWAYVRDQLALRYGCLPPAIDALPARDVAEMLRLATIEHAIAQERERRKPPR